MISRISVVLIVIIGTCFAGWNTISPSPLLVLQQVDQGQNTLRVMDTSGVMKSTQKNSISWVQDNLPNGLTVTAMSVGSNDDVCAIDNSFYGIWCRKYGQTTWVQVPGPSGVYPLYIDIYAYSNNAMVIGDSNGNIYLYGSGSWSQIAFATTLPIQAATIAADGTIWGIGPNGNFYSYNANTRTWNLLNSGNNFYQVDSGLSGTDLVLVSYNNPFLDFTRQSGNIVQFSTVKTSLAIYNGYIVGIDSSNVYYWS